MKLLCPSCQKELTVPDQYAGQPMKCPMCAGTFTAPSLPASVLPVASVVPMGATTAPPADDTYQLATEPRLSSRPKEAVQATAPPPPHPEAPRQPETVRPEPPVVPPAGYEHSHSIRLSPLVAPWIAPAALFLVFLLLFFPWVTAYVGKEWYAQTGWGTGFGGAGSGLGIAYILFFMLALLAAAASSLVPFLPANQLPPVVQQLRPWRGLLVAGVLLFASLFLGVQFLAGFGLEQTVAKPPELKQSEGEPLAQQLADPAQRELARLTVRRTAWVYFACLLHFVAFAGLGLEFCLERRGDRPLPRLDLNW